MHEVMSIQLKHEECKKNPRPSDDKSLSAYVCILYSTSIGFLLNYITAYMQYSIGSCYSGTFRTAKNDRKCAAFTYEEQHCIDADSRTLVECIYSPSEIVCYYNIMYVC